MFKKGDYVIVKCAFCNGCNEYDCDEVFARVISSREDNCRLIFLADGSYCNVKYEYFRRATDRESFLHLTHGIYKFGE